jgi:hypothetical protein
MNTKLIEYGSLGAMLLSMASLALVVGLSVI